MKKVILAMLVVGLIAGQVFAQGNETEFSLNLGGQTNVCHGTAFDNAFFTLDARVSIAIGKSLELSPEVMFTVDDSLHFQIMSPYPGVMLNYKVGNCFFGAGAVLPITFFDDKSDLGNPRPKINIGFKGGNIIFTVYAITWIESGVGFLDGNFIGATIGYRF